MPLPSRHEFLAARRANTSGYQPPVSNHCQPVRFQMNQPTTDDVLARARLLRKLCKETWENAQYLCNTNESATAVEYAMFRDTEVTLRGVKKRNSLMKKRLLNERESYMDGRPDLHRELEEIERDADLIEDIDQWLLVFRNSEVSNRRSMLRSNRHNP
ncbi:hypothetical protein PG996_006834 [Apiospora saccharicola]|uniref:Uncharacterized protein n=1 Tax=Apiospora saccharicola TaxID=335842 RepID=A0ABR1V953_9PEZI